VSAQGTDKDTFIKALMAGLIAFMIWSLLFQRTNPPPSENNANLKEQSDLTVASTPTPTSIPEGFEVDGEDAEQFVELGNIDDVKPHDYPLHLRLSNRGASLVSAWLTDHDQKIDGKNRYPILKPVEIEQSVKLNSLTTSKINVRGWEDIPLGNTYWHAQKQDNSQATFWVDISKDGQEKASSIS